MIRGEPFLVMAKAPMLPEYDVTPHPDPIRPAQRHAKPFVRNQRTINQRVHDKKSMAHRSDHADSATGSYSAVR